MYKVNSQKLTEIARRYYDQHKFAEIQGEYLSATPDGRETGTAYSTETDELDSYIEELEPHLESSLEEYLEKPGQRRIVERER